MDVFLDGLQGFGDQIYQRPFVRTALQRCQSVFLRTPLPEFYWDLKSGGRLKFVKWGTRLRTQRILESGKPGHVWSKPPSLTGKRRLAYTGRDLRRGVSILGSIRKHCGFIPAQDLSFPLKENWYNHARTALRCASIAEGEPFVAVHWPTIRKEWRNISRNPDPDGWRALVKWVNTRYKTLSINDVDGRLEVFDGIPEQASSRYDAGECPVPVIAAILSMAQFCITSPGLWLPLGLSVSARIVLVVGGYLPSRLMVEPWMVKSDFLVIEPEKPCCCVQHEHSCEKRFDVGRALHALAGFCRIEAASGGRRTSVVSA